MSTGTGKLRLANLLLNAFFLPKAMRYNSLISLAPGRLMSTRIRKANIIRIKAATIRGT